LTFKVGKPYHTTGSFPSWIFPETNGFGLFLYGAMGAASVAKHSGTAYMHQFDVSNEQIPSFTMWMKTKVYEYKASNMQVNKLVIKNAKASVADFSADMVGSNLATCTDFGTATYVTGSTKAFRSGGAKVLWDDTLTANFDDVTLTIDNAVDPAEAKSLGVDYAQHILAGSRSITGEATMFVDSSTQLEDYWGASSGPALNQPTIPLQFIWQSSNIVASSAIGTAVKMAGSGAITVTTAGTSTATDAQLFEIKMTTIGAQDKFKWRKDQGNWSSEVSTDTSAITLSDGVTVAFSAKTGCVASDRWFFYAGAVPYALNLYIPAAKITEFTPGSQGNRLSAKVQFVAEMDNTAGVAYDMRAWLCNTASTAYDDL
jgi:hypothetical protein